MFKTVKEALQVALNDWSMMQKASYDEGEEWAERFERDFYAFSDQLRVWMNGLPNMPVTLDEAMNIEEIKWMIEQMPGPLQLNIELELEEIIEGRLPTCVDD